MFSFAFVYVCDAIRHVTDPNNYNHQLSNTNKIILGSFFQ